MSKIFDEWSLYARVIAGDYMRHASIALAVNQYLAARPAPRRVLDLGCGNGSMARACLANRPVEHYLGIDSSADALARLQAAGAPGDGPDGFAIETQCGNLAKAISHLPAEAFDLVLASFSLHHFPQPEQRPILAEIQRVLDPHGVFVWIELVCQPGQSAESYFDSYESHMRDSWTDFLPAEIDQVMNHIRTSDFPVEATAMLSSAREVGLLSAHGLFRDTFFGAWAFPGSETAAAGQK